MASSSSSLSSSSPRQTLIPKSAPALESLIPHLLASKRSLSSVTHVYRANELCTTTRQSLETSVVTTARTSFLRTGITSQLGVLQQVQQNTARTAERAREEFGFAAHDLDAADARLRGTLAKLRETFVEAGLRPEGEAKRNLLDFVDEGGVEGLVGVIKGVMNGARQGLSDFEGGGRSFREEAGTVKELMGSDMEDPDCPIKESSPLPDILHEMEDHTLHMASHLEDLVRHYDKCVTAIKHTEGGGDAATEIANDIPDGVDIEQDIGGPPEPIGEEQMNELLKVIEADSDVVESTVMDIRDRSLVMETLREQVEDHNDQLVKEHESMTTAFKILQGIGCKLPSYITQSQTFVLQWGSEKSKIDGLLEELEGLTHFYDGFLGAYDNLLIEIGRRKTMQQKMEKEVEAARYRIGKLHEDDAQEREAFRQDQGEFLPMDIWPGLMSAPLMFNIEPVNEEMTRVPDISASVIRGAIRRVHGER